MNTYLRKIVYLTFTCLSAAHMAISQTSAVKPQNMGDTYGRLPLSFEANQRQSDSRVKFLSRGSGYSLFLTQDETVLALKNQGKRVSPGAKPVPVALAKRSREPGSEAVLRMQLVGANVTAQVTGLEELPGKSNYFIGNDSTKWRTGIPNYAKVKYANVYQGIDLVYYGTQRQLEFDLVVQPGADPRAIRLDFRTAIKGEHANLRVDNKGDLVVSTSGEEVIFHKPVVYQPTTTPETPVTHKELIDGQFVLTDAHQVSFQVAAYDKTAPLVIDPTLTYSTYLAGTSEDEGYGIAVDASGHAYVTGLAGSADFPISPGVVQTTSGGGLSDAFVSKLNAAGSALLYSTFLGGNGQDFGLGIAVDTSGNAYVTGDTVSSNFPVTAGAFQTSGGGVGSVFVSKLNATGSALLYSTYLGGSGGGELGTGDSGNGIAIDASGNAYVAGATTSTDFPITPGAFQTTCNTCGPPHGIRDAFVSKLNAAGSALLYSTYLGGSGDDYGNGIAVDSSGNAYVTGFTGSSDFPTTPGVFQTTSGGSTFGDAFVSKLNATGSALLYSTYLGGSGDDSGNGIAVDSSGNAYVAGATASSNFPTTRGAFQTSLQGFRNAFVTKLNPAGSALFYSTYLGGSDNDSANGVAVGLLGTVYITGNTNSSNFPTNPGAFQPTFGGSRSGNVFVSKLDAAGSALRYSTYLGGSGFEDVGTGIAVDASGNAYITGGTFSSNFPTTPGAFQTTFRGAVDAFVSKFSFAADLFLRIKPSTTTVHQGDLLTFAFPVWNLGPDVAEGEVLSSLQVPAGTTFDYLRISGTPGLGTCTHPPYGGTGQIICHEGDGMAPNTI